MVYLFVLNVCSFSMLVSNGTSGGMVSPLSDLPGKSLMMLALFVRPLIHKFQDGSERNYVSMYIDPDLTWFCTWLVHEAVFGCFHIICNWPTSSYPKVLNLKILMLLNGVIFYFYTRLNTLITPPWTVPSPV